MFGKTKNEEVTRKIFWEKNLGSHTDLPVPKGAWQGRWWSNDMYELWNRIYAIFYEDRKYCLKIFPKQHALGHEWVDF